MSATAATFSDAITAFFNKFDVDGDGHITIAELVKMMETLRKETNAKALNAPKKAAKLVLNALDTNTNGMIELHEFVAWTKKGVSLTMEKREKFAKSAPERADLVMFISALEKTIPSAAVESAVNRVFEEYDIDHNGHIDLDELTAMIVELGTIHNRGLPSIDATRSAAKLAMDALDENKNGTVEKNEFVDWIRKGLTMTVEQRNVFSKKGDDRKGLVYFLEACELEMNKTLKDEGTIVKLATPAVGQKAGRREQYQRLLHSIFMNYDNDGDLFIDDKELVAMMMETINKYGAMKVTKEQLVEPAKQVMKILDNDQNGKLDEAEFVTWVNEGLTMSSEKRIAFGKKSTARALLVKYLEATEVWMNQLKPVESAVHKTFMDYDIDEDGHITEAELQALITEMTGELGDHNTSVAASKKIMAIFDLDGNGLLEEDEFYAWVRKGGELTKEQREEFRGKSPEKARLVRLLEKIESLAETQDLDPIKLGIRNIFQKYDVDDDKHIDVDELAAMMTELLMIHMPGQAITDHNMSVKTAEKVLGMLDLNKNGVLEEKEFMDWIEKGRKMTERSREKYKKKNAINAHMVHFLLSVEKELNLNVPQLPEKGDEIRLPGKT